MTADFEDALCALYGLGSAQSPLVPVTGGLRHRTYRLRAADGEYAVKILSPHLLRESGLREQFGRGERIAAALAAGGIPAAVALDGPAGPVSEVGRHTLIVSPWQEGNALPPGPAPPPQARQIGILLGRIHALAVPAKNSPPPRLPDPFPDRHWQDLARRAAQERAAWADALEAALPALTRWGRQAAEADRALTQPWVISHRDLDQKNVLWRDPQTPVIIDWEAAGPVAPVLDVATAALNWGGQSVGPPDRAAFEAVLDGYRSVRAFAAEDARPALECRLAAWLVWLEFSVGRALGAGAAEASEQAVAAQEVAGSLAALFALSEGIPRWAEWCQGGGAASSACGG